MFSLMADFPILFFKTAPQGRVSVWVNWVDMPSLVGISSESTSIPNNHRSYKAETPLNPRIPVRLHAVGRPRRIFSSRKDAKPQRKARLLQLSALGKFQFIATEEQYHFFAQRNNGPLGMTSGALCYLSHRIAGACPEELRGDKYSFFFSERRRGAKKWWSDRYDFPPRRTGFPSLRLGVFARYILFFFSQRLVRRGGQVCGLDQLMLKNLKQKKELHHCNSFNSIEPLAGIEPATY